MRKIFIILLICALILGCAGVVTALEITISPQSPKVGEMVTFTANNPPDNVTRYEWSIEAANNPPDNVTRYEWSIEDVTNTDNQVTHTFDKTGTYTVIVTAYNESSEIGKKETTFSVTENTPIKPVLKNFVGNKTSGPAPLTIQFDYPVYRRDHKWIPDRICMGLWIRLHSNNKNRIHHLYLH